ncbi:MAG: type II toxin-antitoxin system prevent-host-death family antitoxin [Roseococcus sp.]
MTNHSTLAEAKAHLSALVSRAERGEETIITRHGKPVAKLVPVRPARRQGGELAGAPGWENFDHAEIARIFAPLNTDEELRAEGWEV